MSENVTGTHGNEKAMPSRKLWARLKRLTITFVVALTVGTVTALYLRSYAYARLIEYSPVGDYTYQFAHAATVTVRLHDDGFTFPATVSAADTALLRMELSATLMGRIVEPAVETTVGATSVTEYQERGARGVRFLNISPILSSSPLVGRNIRMKGRRVRWAEQDAMLLLFKNRCIDNERILIFAPHPDDAEVAAFGVYSHRDAYVVTVTAGEAPLRAYSAAFPDREERSLICGRVRAWDSVAVPLWGGLDSTRTANMGYFDGTLRAMDQARGKPVRSKYAGRADMAVFRSHNQAGLLPMGACKPTWPQLIADLRTVISKVKPTAIVAPHPLMDAHKDHQWTTIALCDALEGEDVGQLAFYLYTVHGRNTLLHPFGPQGGITSLAPWFGDPLQHRGLFSYQIDEQRRIDKFFAMEAMHALRPPPKFARRQRTKAAAALGWLKNLIRGTDDYVLSHFRRAFRPNELFFVESVESTRRMAEKCRREED